LIKQVDGGKELELGEDYVMSPKDLCTIDFIEKILEVGVDCFKIEGRNRSPEYVATVTKTYRTVIDFYYSYKKHDKKFFEDFAKLKATLAEKLETVYHRGESSGFFLGKPINEWVNGHGNQATEKKAHVGKVLKFFKKISVAEILIQNNKIKIGDTIIFQGPTTGSVEAVIMSLENNHKPIKLAEKGEKIAIKIDSLVRENDEVYVMKKVDQNRNLDER
jgi:putative protease